MITALKRLPVLFALLAMWFFSAPLAAQEWREHEGARLGETQNRAYDYGYRRGEDRGRDDARHHRAFDYRRDRYFRGARDGWNRRYGDRDPYRDEYRRGFIEGYTRAYRANASRRDYDRDDRYIRRW